MDTKDLQRRAGIITEGEGSLSLYSALVKAGGVNMTTAIYAESVDKANRLLEKMYGKSAVITRPKKWK